MQNLSRVVWSEGMYLGPHHFQAQSRYFEDTIHFAAGSLWFAPFGFLEFEFNTESLRNGTLAVSHARGVFEDGLAFDMPSADPLPDPRQIGEIFSPTADSLLVYLTVPVRRSLGGNTSLDGIKGQAKTRFVAEERKIPDEIMGGEEKPVRFGRKNFELLLENEETDGRQVLPIARVRRDGSGNFIFDERFIPPLLRSSASPALMSMTRRLMDILGQKSIAFGGSSQGFERQQSGMSPGQVASFWFLHAVRSALASLRHLYYSKQGHPEELYTELLRLAGSLCTFSFEASAADLPLYDHLGLQICFEELDLHIREHLELVLPTNCITIRLHPTQEDYFWEAELKDSRVFGPSRWFFSLRSPMSETDLITKTPDWVKICSSRFVPELVKRALRGLKLSYVSSPPAALSPQVGNHYFTVDRSGPCWDHLLDSRRVGIYVPGDISSPELELLVLLES